MSCGPYLFATIELPSGKNVASIDLATIRLADVVPAARTYSHVVDTDHDGINELEVRFDLAQVAPLLQPGWNPLSVSGRAGGLQLRGSSTVEVVAAQADVWITPRTFSRSGATPDIQARLTFAPGVDASAVDVTKIRLNGTVTVKTVVSVSGNRLTVRFARAAVNAILSVGDHVEVRVSGPLLGTTFLARDVVRVKP